MGPRRVRQGGAWKENKSKGASFQEGALRARVFLSPGAFCFIGRKSEGAGPGAEKGAKGGAA